VSRLSEDPDPLLAFANEPGGVPTAAPPSDPATQPVAATEDAPLLPAAPVVDPLIARVNQLERALEDSRKQVSTLKSEMASLVRAIGDIKKPMSRPAATLPRAARSGIRVVAATVGIVIGLSLGVLAWMYLTGDADPTIAAPVSTRGSVADPPRAIEVRQVSEEPKPAASRAVNAPRTVEAPRTVNALQTLSAPNTLSASKALIAPKALKTSDAPQASRYVGTLSIDSSPAGEVFLDRETAGRTPLRLTNLRAGSHLIWIERDGYQRFTRVVQVPSDRVTRLFADLQPNAVR
jgi:hypothetical protein